MRPGRGMENEIQQRDVCSWCNFDCRKQRVGLSNAATNNIQYWESETAAWCVKKNKVVSNDEKIGEFMMGDEMEGVINVIVFRS